MRKYTEKRNADGYTVILSVSNPSPSNTVDCEDLAYWGKKRKLRTSALSRDSSLAVVQMYLCEYQDAEERGDI